ncbi:hypothetical protein DSM43519_01904 [Mycobacterium marinum]|nr:hypothetical protein CCUG20998_02954 [Mycobacterium marinum]RFZ20676.1 hypothetical protein DSM44344_03812 [Mycobacterium marinum]RFZ24985.1 hypothetical protein DSM43519_01904 [Mycobacterium marinum]RFZ38249.1 hypothetical protein NCTC2275_00889 [Mycobacterium marinum]
MVLVVVGCCPVERDFVAPGAPRMVTLAVSRMVYPLRMCLMVSTDRRMRALVVGQLAYRYPMWPPASGGRRMRTQAAREV